MQEEKDELTLSELNRQLQLLGGFLYGAVLQYIKYMRRYRIWMVVILAIVVSAAGIYGYRSQGTFQGTASYTYNYLQKKTYGEMIGELNKLVETHDYTQLERLLQLDSRHVKSIAAISAQNIYGSPLSDDMNENDRFKIFYITMKATDKNIFGKIALSIENYLNDNVAVQEYKKRNELKFEQNIRYRQSELQTIDSIQHAYINSLNKPVATLLPAEAGQFNPVQLSEKGEKITEEIADMQSFLEDPRAVKLQTPFLVSDQGSERSLLKILFAGAVVFIVLSVAVIFILSTFSKKNYAS